MRIQQTISYLGVLVLAATLAASSLAGNERERTVPTSLHRVLAGNVADGAKISTVGYIAASRGGKFTEAQAVYIDRDSAQNDVVLNAVKLDGVIDPKFIGKLCFISGRLTHAGRATHYDFEYVIEIEGVAEYSASPK